MNILGFNIGQNYKGILNLGSTINSPLSGTLQAVTDGMGVASPLQLSTDSLKITSSLNGNVSLIFENTNNGGFGQLWNAGNALSTYTLQWRGFNTGGAGGRIYPEGMFIGAQSAPSARLHVRGDGTNDISRFENTSANLVFRVGTGNAANPQATVGAAMNLYSRYLDGDIGTSSSVNGINAGYQSGHQNDWAVSSHYFTSTSRVFNNASVITGTAGNARFVQSFAIQNANSSAINYRSLAVEYTINNTVASTGTATGIFLNATETALNGMGHRLMDLQVGGVSIFRVANDGAVTTSGNLTIPSSNFILFGTNGRFRAQSDGVFTFTSNSGSDFNRLQFGGTTNAFPALKRNGAALEVRLADDSGFAALSCAALSASGISSFAGGVAYVSTSGWANIQGRLGIGFFGDTNASAILQADSTTRGFLPPRGTNAQMLAIATPATGLMFYDTTNNKLNVYDGTNWVAMH